MKKKTNFNSKKKYILAVILVLLSIILIVFTITANAENNTAGSTKEIENEKTLVKTTASLSRGSSVDNVVDIDTLTEQLNRYAGSGVTSVTAKTSDVLLITFLASGREYEIDINTGNLSGENYIVKYTITYDANGGIGAPEIQEKYDGQDITLSTIIPTRDGFEFVGWNTNAYETTATYQPGSAFSLNADTTLYAIWSANQYTIAYNANGGTGAPEAQTKIKNVDLILSEELPTRANAEFLGWSTDSSATSISYYPGDTYSEQNGTTLYAVWGLWVMKDSFLWHEEMLDYVMEIGDGGKYTIYQNPGPSVNSTDTDELNLFTLNCYDKYPYVWMGFDFSGYYGMSYTTYPSHHLLVVNEMWQIYREEEFSISGGWWIDEPGASAYLETFEETSSGETYTEFYMTDIFVAPCESDLISF